MALIDRALQKAYQRPVREPATTPASTPETAERGWVEGVRAPRTPRDAANPESASLRLDRPPDANPAATHVPAEPPAISKTTLDTAGELNASTAPARVQSTAASAWNWPRICDAILASPARGDLRQFVCRLHETFLRLGPRCVLFASTGRGMGQSSIVLTLSRLLCEQTPMRILVVDLNLDHPELATQLQVETEHGPTAAATGASDGPPSPIALIPGRFDLASLAHSASGPAAEPSLHAAGGAMLREARLGYDLILIDAGTWEHSARFAARECRPGDAMVRIVTANDAGDAAHEDSTGSGAGLEILGVIETLLSTGEQRCTKATGD